MKVPFFDLKRQYTALKPEVEPAVLQVLESCGFIGGSTVVKFEQEAAAYLGVGHAVSCGNGTGALVLALRACGVGAGDEVITTSFSFFATAEAVASIGAIPVFCDIHPEDFTLNAAMIEEKITPKTKVILPVHLFGAPCEMDAILDIARRHQLKVVEDAAQAIGCEYRGQKIGSTADLSCFSFYPTKNLGGMGDGGMITTNNDDFAVILRALREHGAGQTGAEARTLLGGGVEQMEALQETTPDYNPYKYLNSIIGYNSRLDAVQAAVLSLKLKHLPAYNEARAKIADYYGSHLTDAVKAPSARPDGKHCWHQYVIRTEHKEKLCAFLNERGVGVGTFYPIPLHLQKALDYLGYRKGDFPAAEAAAAETVCLPIFPELTDAEVAYVTEQVNAFFLR